MPLMMCNVCLEDKTTNEIVILYAETQEEKRQLAVLCNQCYNYYILSSINNAVRYAQDTDLTRRTKEQNKED